MMQGPQANDRQLDVLIERLSPMADNPAARALLIEARRLKSVMDNWRSVPPAGHVRDEMMARVMHLSAAASDILPMSSMGRVGATGMNNFPTTGFTQTFAGLAGLGAGLVGNTGMGSTGIGGTGMRGTTEETVITEGLSALPSTPLDVHPVKINEELGSHFPMLRDPYSKRADAYRALRHQLSKKGDPKVIGVTSAGRREGKTTTAINLAASLREGARGRVLILEANLRVPSVAATLGFMPPMCFQEQVIRHRQEPLDPWVAAEILPSLHALAINPVNKYAPLIDPIGFSIAVDRLRLAGYDYIVVDTTPVLESADVNLIADSVDGFVISAIARRSGTKAIRRAVDQLGTINFLGAVLLE